MESEGVFAWGVLVWGRFGFGAFLLQYMATCMLMLTRIVISCDPKFCEALAVSYTTVKTACRYDVSFRKYLGASTASKSASHASRQRAPGHVH